MLTAMHACKNKPVRKEMRKATEAKKTGPTENPQPTATSSLTSERIRNRNVEVKGKKKVSGTK